jgi:hypothetical protein
MHTIWMLGVGGVPMGAEIGNLARRITEDVMARQ